MIAPNEPDDDGIEVEVLLALIQQADDELDTARSALSDAEDFLNQLRLLIHEGTR